MQDKQPHFSRHDAAIAQLLVLTANGAPLASPPVSDEELAVFVEGDAKQKLGESRFYQILHQLSENEALYEDWLLLCELNSAKQTQEPSKTAYEKADDGWRSWLHGLLTAQVALATITAIVCTAIVFQLMHSLAPQDLSLAVRGADQLPVKASQYEAANTPLEHSTALSNIAAWFQCIDIDAPSPYTLCYSKTLKSQHWMMARHSGFAAISPLIEADRILSVTSFRQYIAVNYASQQAQHLILLKLAALESSLESKELHHDVVTDGYFDHVELSSDGLSYQAIGRTTEPVKRQVSFQAEDH